VKKSLKRQATRRAKDPLARSPRGRVRDGGGDHCCFLADACLLDVEGTWEDKMMTDYREDGMRDEGGGGGRGDTIVVFLRMLVVTVGCFSF
jgi:hypothetical protein